MRKTCDQFGSASSRGSQQFLTAAALGFVFVIASLRSATPVHAQALEAPPLEPPQPKYGWVEMWGGADAMRDVWLLYSGITLAPWSEHIYAQGWRLRAQAGYGQFDYTLSDGALREHFKGAVTYADALVGYHWRLGDLTAKAFAGISTIDRMGVASAARKRLFEAEYGPKVMLEFWLNVGETQWTSLNLSYTTAHDTASARWRWGFKLTPELSVGPEVRFDTNDFRTAGHDGFFDQYLTRGGGFVTYKWPGVELSVAGGIGTRFRGIERDDAEGLTPYATVNLLIQY